MLITLQKREMANTGSHRKNGSMAYSEPQKRVEVKRRQLTSEDEPYGAMQATYPAVPAPAKTADWSLDGRRVTAAARIFQSNSQACGAVSWEPCGRQRNTGSRSRRRFHHDHDGHWPVALAAEKSDGKGQRRLQNSARANVRSLNKAVTNTDLN